MEEQSSITSEITRVPIGYYMRSPYGVLEKPLKLIRIMPRNQ